MSETTDQPLRDTEFTYGWYRTFLERLRSAGYEFRPFGRELEGREVTLRHDVDLSVEAAVRMARLEADLGIRSTYCVLVTSPLYQPFDGEHRELIAEIEALGHDVALHFSTHEYWGPDEVPGAERLHSRVRDEQAILGKVVDGWPDTVSFHIPPEWVLDRSFRGFQSTYAPAYYSEIDYVADSSQRWREEPPDLAELDGAVQILTHPGLWGAVDGSFEERVRQAVTDACDRTRRRTRQEFVDGAYN